MNVKTWIPLVLAVLLGLMALVVGRKAVAPRAPAQPANTVSVVVAARDVTPGKVLAAEDVRTARLPKDVAPARPFGEVKEVVGRTVTAALLKGQPVLEGVLASQGTGGGVQALIPAGLRGITVEVNEFSGLGGMLVPGCRVDVVATVRDDKTQQQVSRTILQNIKVLAVGRQFNPNPPPPPENAPPPPPTNNVTLLVTPRQAQTLQLAMQGGRPWLVLRNGGDGAVVEADPTLPADLRVDPAGNGIGKGAVSFLGPNGSTTRTAGPEAAIGSGRGPGTTEPVVADPTTPGRRATRTIQVIRGGVESEVSVPVPAPAARPAQQPQFTEGKALPPAAPGAVSSTKD